MKEATFASPKITRTSDNTENEKGCIESYASVQFANSYTNQHSNLKLRKKCNELSRKDGVITIHKNVWYARAVQ